MAANVQLLDLTPRASHANIDIYANYQYSDVFGIFKVNKYKLEQELIYKIFIVCDNYNLFHIVSEINIS